MIKIDEMGLKLCRMQAKVFETSLSKEECSSLIFMRRFMNSQVARRMDAGGFLFEACDVNQIIEEVDAEFGESSYGSEKYTENEMYWIGYMYRYWAYTYQQTSKQIYRFIKPKELRGLYYPYHSLDPAQAIERILEARGVAVNEEDLTARGVELLREIIKRESRK